MSSRDQTLKALKAFHRRPIDFDNVPRELWIREEQYGEAAEDRGVALVGTAFLEGCLRDAILTHMVPLNSDERQRLFGPEGPLSSLSAKIRLGYSLGIYNRVDQRDLDCIRNIRNVFAHFHERVDFGSEEIMDACALLRNRWYLSELNTRPTERTANRATFANRVLLYSHLLSPEGLPDEKVRLPDAAETL